MSHLHNHESSISFQPADPEGDGFGDDKKKEQQEGVWELKREQTVEELESYLDMMMSDSNDGQIEFANE